MSVGVDIGDGGGGDSGEGSRWGLVVCRGVDGDK